MRIEGDLATYELSDLLQWLAQGHKTGTLVIRDDHNTHRLGFDQGRIVMSASSDRERCLDRFLLARGLIDEKTLERAERLRAATQMHSGQVLVTLGAITEEQLASALRQKTEAMICELLTWTGGSFEFTGGEHSDQGRVPISLEVTKLLLESMQRLDDAGQSATPAESGEVSVQTPVAAAPSAVVPAPEPQTREGLVLAEVLDPDSAHGGLDDDPAAAETATASELTAHYAAVARAPRRLWRLAPFAAVVVLTLSAAGYYLMDRQASAQPAAASGTPLLFTQTAGPPLPTAAVAVDNTTAPPAAAGAAATPVAPAQVADTAAEQRLRVRYERELAALRRQLAESRRAGSATPEATAVNETDGREPRPASTTAVRTVARGSDQATPFAARAVPAETAAGEPPAAVEPAITATPPPARSAEPPAPAAPSATEVAPEPPTPAEPAAPDTAAPAVIAPEVVRPALIQRPQPRYPDTARRLAIGAEVTLRVLVGEDGRVIEIERVGPKAGLGFDRAAEEAARASNWRPGSRDGEPAAMWTELRFQFQP